MFRMEIIYYDFYGVPPLNFATLHLPPRRCRPRLHSNLNVKWIPTFLLSFDPFIKLAGSYSSTRVAVFDMSVSVFIYHHWNRKIFWLCLTKPYKCRISYYFIVNFDCDLSKRMLFVVSVVISCKDFLLDLPLLKLW